MCAGNFTSAFFYNCHSCSGERETLALGIGAVCATAVLFIFLVAMCELVRQDDRGLDDEEGDTGRWWKRRTSCLELFSNALPRTAVKILVVVWQITTQVWWSNSLPTGECFLFFGIRLPCYYHEGWDGVDGVDLATTEAVRQGMYDEYILSGDPDVSVSWSI